MVSFLKIMVLVGYPRYEAPPYDGRTNFRGVAIYGPYGNASSNCSDPHIQQAAYVIGMGLLFAAE